MKNNILKILIMLIISVLAIGILNNSYAVSVCTIKGEFSPNNPTPGQEVTIDISATEINEAIAGLGFSLEYDVEKFDIVSATPTDLWDIGRNENLFTIVTKNNEAINNTGKIATIKLKVKDNALISESTIKLTKIEVATDDGDSVTIGEISKTINITTKEGQQENKPSGDDNKSSEDKPTGVDSEHKNDNENTNNNNNDTNNDNKINDDNNENKGNENQNQQATEKPTASTEVDSNKIVVVNGNTNSGSTTKAESSSKDASTTNKLLPKTGLTMIYHIAIAATLIGMGTSFIAYRKYKNI